MTPIENFLTDFLSRTVGSVIITDVSTGAMAATRDVAELLTFAGDAVEPWLDLVTTTGEAIGFFASGDAGVVKPTPSIALGNGMIYLVDGDPVAQQANDQHCIRWDVLEKQTACLKPLRTYLVTELNISTPATTVKIELSHGRRRDTPQGKWRSETSSFDQFADALMDHQEGSKDGRCFLQGVGVNGHRKATAMAANYVLGIDLDSGAMLEDLIETIVGHQLEAVIYTTHSHLTNETAINRDHFSKWAGDATPVPALVGEYLKNVKGMLSHITDEVVILDDCHHSEDGVTILVEHRPIPKYRVVFPLSEPFVFSKRGGTQQDAILEWKERYAGVCAALRLNYDEKCTDPARLFYMPRHVSGGAFGSWRIYGMPLNLDLFDRVKLKRGGSLHRAARQNAFVDAAGGYAGAGDRSRYITGSGYNLRSWAAKYANRFEIEGLLRDVVDSDFLREPRTGGKPGVHVECPFEAEHSSYGGNGTYVVNASDNLDDGREGGFTFQCMHNACAGRDRLDFIGELIHQGVVTTVDLEDETYRFALEDDESVNAEQESAKADPNDEETHLDHLNNRYAVVRLANRVAILCQPDAPGGAYGLISERDFKLIEGNRIVFRHEGNKIVKVNVAVEWLRWEKRSQYKGIGFHPDGKVPTGHYNSFNGWPISAKPGSWSLLQRHMLDNICRGDQTHFEYLVTWLADILQNPGAKPGVAMVITGKKGTGKSKVADVMCHLIGRYATKVTHSSRITGNFNSHQDSKLLLVADEAKLGSDSRSEGVLKDLITSDKLQIERKGYDVIDAPNLMRFIIISNDEWAVRATFGDERRYFVLDCGDGNQQDHKFFAAIDDQMTRGGYEGMLHDLLKHVPANGWQSLRQPPITRHLKVQQVSSLSGVERFFYNLLVDGIYEPGDGSDAIILDECSSAEISGIDLRAAVLDYLTADHPQEKAKAKVDHLTAMASKWCNAKVNHRLVPGAKNQSRFLMLPPLAEARDWAEQTMGIQFSTEQQAVQLEVPMVRRKAKIEPVTATFH